MKEQLTLFLERIPGLLAFDEFLPKQQGELLELRLHQVEALEALARFEREPLPNHFLSRSFFRLRGRLGPGPVKNPSL